MREKIIRESIESLRREGLRFSVDLLASRLKISKKTVYKYFPNKEALALAMYEAYYAEVTEAAERLAAEPSLSAKKELLRLYFDSKMMTRREIFNKYQLNETVFSDTSARNTALWNLLSGSLRLRCPERDAEAVRVIVDGSFEKLCDSRQDPDAVIERLVELL